MRRSQIAVLAAVAALFGMTSAPSKSTTCPHHRAALMTQL
jgi:hypothetical protein